MSKYILSVNNLSYNGKIIKGECREATIMEEQMIDFVINTQKYSRGLWSIDHSTDDIIYSDTFSPVDVNTVGSFWNHGKASIDISGLCAYEAFDIYKIAPNKLKEAYDNASWRGEIEINIHQLHKDLFGSYYAC